MRYFYSTLLACFLSFNAVADLNPAHQKFADMLLSDDLRQIKGAAKAIDKKEISDPALMDIAAEILLKKYPHVTSAEIDTYAWLARAIGSSENGRYHDALSEVVNSADDKKLVKHAKRALKDLGDKEGEQYTAGIYELPAGLYEKEDDSERDQRVERLLMEGNLSSLKEGARAMIDTKAQNVELTDIAAEILMTYYSDASDDQIDTLSWVATALGASNSGRYFAVLEEVEENGAHRKLRKYADRALEAHGQPKGKQYEKGMLGKDLPDYDY